MLKFAECREGEVVEGLVVLTDVQLKKTKTQKDYLALTVSDGTDTISGNIWDYKVSDRLPATGKVYFLKAVIGSYMGTKQLTNPIITLQDEQDLTPFNKHYVEDAAGIMVWHQLMLKIEALQEPFKTIVNNVYATFGEELRSATSAASHHHCGIYGNICHTLEVCEIAEGLVTSYHACEHTVPVSRDLVVAGALLHDIGKAAIYHIEGAKISYNIDGQLFDHIAMGVKMLYQANQFCPYHGTLGLLEHIILSHHGEQEYGSPTTPAFIEAEMVCRADGISALLNTVIDYNRKAITEGKETTDKIFVGRNRPWLLQRDVADTIMNDMEEVADG